jgi:hypothetical protein
MDNKTKKILWGGGLIALGIIVYKLVFKKEPSQVQGGGGGETNNGFPIYPNPLCNDGEAGGCEFDQRVQQLQEYLNGEGYDVEEDGLFGDETAQALEDYLDGVPEAEYTALGYNYVENSNYITLAFYNDHLP